MSETRTIARLEDLRQAREGSYYTIAGCGGDLNEWVQGYEDLMAEAGIGKPTTWFTTIGALVNAFAGESLLDADRYEYDLTFLLFPLEGLNVPKLAMFKMQMQDRWFDDVIDNMRRHSEGA